MKLKIKCYLLGHDWWLNGYHRNGKAIARVECKRCNKISALH